MEIINKVKNSGLQTLDLSDFLPNEENLVGLDIAPILWQGIALKEKDFREYLKETNWSTYQGKIVHVYCSADAIVPPWAYMLLASALHDFAEQTLFGTKDEVLEDLVYQKIIALDSALYLDARVVIKGCARISNNEKMFTAITQKLRGAAKSIMYGEPCSTVPIYKAPRKSLD